MDSTNTRSSRDVVVLVVLVGISSNCVQPKLENSCDAELSSGLNCRVGSDQKQFPKFRSPATILMSALCVDS